MFNWFLRKFSKEESSWIKYDIANSAYTLTIITVLFPILYGLVTEGVFSSDAKTNEDTANTIFLAVTGLISFIVAVLSPILGSMSDFKGYKMKFFKFSLYLGLLFGILLSIPSIPWEVLLVVYAISNIGYTAANVFYDSFLTDVTEEDNYNMVSSAGYAWGYIGSCVPFILGIAVYGAVDFGIIKMDPKLAISIAFVISLLWWWLYSLPMLKNVKQVHYLEKTDHWFKDTFTRLGNTVRKIAKQPKLFYFLLAYFFFIDAVYTIIKSAVKIGESYTNAAGEKILGAIDLLLVVFIVQIIAFPCAIIFGKLSKRFGEVKMMVYGIFVYIVICIIGFYLGEITGNVKFDLYIFAGLIGTAQGGLQAVSRSYFGKLIPKQESGEYYGFFNIFGRFASVMGPFLMAATIAVSETRFATLSLIPLLVLGFTFLMLSTLYSKHTV